MIQRLNHGKHAVWILSCKVKNVVGFTNVRTQVRAWEVDGLMERFCCKTTKIKHVAETAKKGTKAYYVPFAKMDTRPT